MLAKRLGRIAAKDAGAVVIGATTTEQNQPENNPVGLAVQLLLVHELRANTPISLSFLSYATQKFRIWNETLDDAMPYGLTRTQR